MGTLRPEDGVRKRLEFALDAGGDAHAVELGIVLKVLTTLVAGAFCVGEVVDVDEDRVLPARQRVSQADVDARALLVVELPRDVRIVAGETRAVEVQRRTRGDAVFDIAEAGVGGPLGEALDLIADFVERFVLRALRVEEGDVGIDTKAVEGAGEKGELLLVA